MSVEEEANDSRMTETSLNRQIFHLAIPTIVGFLGIILFEAIDIFWIGKPFQSRCIFMSRFGAESLGIDAVDDQVVSGMFDSNLIVEPLLQVGRDGNPVMDEGAHKAAQAVIFD